MRVATIHPQTGNLLVLELGNFRDAYLRLKSLEYFWWMGCRLFLILCPSLLPLTENLNEHWHKAGPTGGTAWGPLGGWISTGYCDGGIQPEAGSGLNLLQRTCCRTSRGMPEELKKGLRGLLWASLGGTQVDHAWAPGTEFHDSETLQEQSWLGA
jgi:hypothetical protein